MYVLFDQLSDEIQTYAVSVFVQPIHRLLTPQNIQLNFKRGSIIGSNDPIIISFNIKNKITECTVLFAATSRRAEATGPNGKGMVREAKAAYLQGARDNPTSSLLRSQDVKTSWLVDSIPRWLESYLNIVLLF